MHFTEHTVHRSHHGALQQEALLKALAEGEALHLIPPLCGVPWAANAHLDGSLDGCLLPVLASLLADGHLQKSMLLCHAADLPLPATLALHHLKKSLFPSGT